MFSGERAASAEEHCPADGIEEFIVVTGQSYAMMAL